MGVSSLGLTFMGYSPLDSIFTVASAEGTVGLSVISIADMNPVGKLILMANMFLGRLEIIPFLVMLYIAFNAIFNLKLNASFLKRKDRKE